MKEEILRFENVTQIEDEITLLNNFKLNVFKGEIMGLICINDHGRESLISLLQENTSIYFGRIYFQEKLVNDYVHSDLSSNRISIIESQSRLIETLSVSENVFVMRKGFKKYLINPRVLDRQLQGFIEELDIKIHGSQLVLHLSPYEKCVVELLKAVIAGVKLIVLRDLSNYLSSTDLYRFQLLVKYYCEKGISFLYMCNHHEEAFKICTRVSLMKDGKILKVLEKKFFSAESISPFIADFHSTKILAHSSEKSEGLLRFDKVSTDRLNQMSFSIGRGKCVLLLDVDNTSLLDIQQILSGEKEIDSGRIYFNERVADRQMQKPAANDTCFIAENPTEKMLFEDLNYLDNLCFLIDKKKPRIHMSKKIKKSIIKEYQQLIGSDIFKNDIKDVTPSSLYNLIYYRIHICNPKLVVCIQPFSGADMYLRRHIIQLIEALKTRGITVIILGVSISDSLLVSDQMLMIEDGKVIQEYERSEFAVFQTEATTPFQLDK